MAGGFGGLAVALLGLAIVRMQPNPAAELAHLDLTMLAATFLVSLLAALAAGLRASVARMPDSPALQLKSQ